MDYLKKRLTVAGIEVPSDTRNSPQGTQLRLSNGMYLGDVQDLSLNANGGDMWTVDVTVRTHITNEQVLELFGKIEHGKAQAATTEASNVQEQ